MNRDLNNFKKSITDNHTAIKQYLNNLINYLLINYDSINVIYSSDLSVKIEYIHNNYYLNLCYKKNDFIKLETNFVNLKFKSKHEQQLINELILNHYYKVNAVTLRFWVKSFNIIFRNMREQ